MIGGITGGGGAILPTFFILGDGNIDGDNIIDESGNFLVSELAPAPPFTGLLDTYPGAAAGYSLRRLSSTYTGFAIKVQDNVGGATLDVGFDSNGELNTSAIVAYGGSNDVFVETWYDQSGSGNNATQATSANRPKIYDGTTGVIMENGKPAVQFDGSNDTMKNTNFTSLIGSPNFFTAAISFDDTDNQYFIDSDSPGRSATGIVSGNYSVRGLNGGAASTGQHLMSVSQLSSGATLFVDSSQVLTNGSSTLVTHTNILISDNALPLDGKVQELILWGSDESANRTGIETNINNFYSIY